MQACLNAQQKLTQNLQHKFDDITNTAPDDDNDDSDSTSPARKQSRRQEDDLDSDQSVEEAEAEEVKGLGRWFLILHRSWLKQKEHIFQVKLNEDYDENERFNDINTLVQGQLREIRSLLLEKYLGDAFKKTCNRGDSQHSEALSANNKVEAREKTIKEEC